MEDQDLRELLLMCDEALEALKQGEVTSFTSEHFNKIRAVGVACLDGDKLNAQLNRRIPIRSKFDFERSVLHIARFSSLSGGRGNNKNTENSLATIKSSLQKIVENPEKQRAISRIFYSWQATLPNATNRSFIQTSIELALKELNMEVPVESRVTLDSDTANIPGSPDIVNIILEKIDNSDVFIADVSIVNESTPNPNVMFELGYAIKALTDKRIIMLFNSSYGSVKDLPFDLGFKRQMIYEVSEDEKDKPEKRKELAKRISKAIININGSE